MASNSPNSLNLLDSKNSKNFKFWNYVTLSVYWFAFSFLWGGFLSVVLPALNKPLVAPIFGEGNAESARGVMTALGIFISMLVQPLAGAISDVSTHPMGRRRPFMIVGTIGGFVALTVIAFATNWWFLLLGYLILQFTDNLAQGAYQGLMPDVVPEDKRGKASAALSVSQLSGTLVGAVVPGILQGLLGEITGSRITLLLVGIVFVIAILITVVFVKETPHVQKVKISPWQAGLAMFRGVGKYPDFIRLMVARLFFLMGPASVSLFVAPFLEKNGFVAPRQQNGQYVLDSAGRPVVEAGSTLSLILGLVIVGAVVAAYPAALLSEKIGRKKVIYVASVIGSLGGLGLLAPYWLMSDAVTKVRGLDLAAQQVQLDNTRPLAIGLCVLFGALVGTSWGAFMAVDWAFATDLIPLNEAGRFMGLSNLATGGCQAVAAFIGGFVVDGAPGYVGLFILVASYYIISCLVLTRVRETRGAINPVAALKS